MLSKRGFMTLETKKYWAGVLGYMWNGTDNCPMRVYQNSDSGPEFEPIVDFDPTSEPYFTDIWNGLSAGNQLMVHYRLHHVKKLGALALADKILNDRATVLEAVKQVLEG